MTEAKRVAVQGPDAGGLELFARRMARLLEKFGGRRGVDGFVDRVLAGEVIGWAFDPKKPHRRVHVVARCDGRIVAETLADLPRKDLAQESKGDGKHGFNLRLPAAFLDGSPRKVRIEVGVGPARRLLRGGAITVSAKRPGGALPPPPKASACHGVLESVVQGCLSGWAAHPRNGGTPAVVDVYDDERYLGSVTADRPRPGLKEQGAPSGALGFQFRLPAAMDESAYGRIRARIAGTRIDLRRSESFPGANGRRTDAAAPSAPQPAPRDTPVAGVAAEPAPAPADASPPPPHAPRASGRQVALLITAEAAEGRMRRGANAWAAQAWGELAIAAVGANAAPADGEHRFGPGDDARLRSFLAEVHSAVLAGPEEMFEPTLARSVALGRPLSDVLTWERTPNARRDAERLAVLLGCDAPGAFAVRGSLLAAYPGALARELAAGDLTRLLTWLAQTPAARWGRLAGALSHGAVAPSPARVVPPPPSRITVAVWPQWSKAALGSLRSLAAAAAQDCELEVLVPAKAPVDEVRAALERSAPGLRRLTVRPVDGPAEAGAGGWLRALGEAASHEAVVFCRSGVELAAGAGALSHLAAWACHPLVGAATVEITADEPDTPLAGLALRDGRAGWEAVSAFAPSLQGQARPVLAAPAALMAVSRARLAAADGFDAERFPEDGAELDLAIRLRREGLASALIGDIAASAPAALLAPPVIAAALSLFDADELAAAADAWPAAVHPHARRRAPDAAE